MLEIDNCYDIGSGAYHFIGKSITVLGVILHFGTYTQKMDKFVSVC